MPDIPCPIVIDCPCDNSPFANLSSEAPDLPVYFAPYYAKVPPPLGTYWRNFGCQVICESNVSQEAADLCAAENGFECGTSTFVHPTGSGSTPPVPPALGPSVHGTPYAPHTNTEQHCGAVCGDGLEFVFTVPAGAFAAFTQSQADAKAKSYACRQAQLRRICLSSLVSPICLDEEYSATITATGRFLATGTQTNNWTLQSGTLPPGLTFHGGALPSGGAATITGTPTTAGSFTFYIGVTDPQGNFMSKAYTLVVATIDNAVLPDAQTGDFYSQQLLASALVDPVFTIISGTLPDGLFMNATGLIFGTPTGPDEVALIVQFEDEDIVCSCAVSFEVVGGCRNVPVVVSTTPVPNAIWALAVRDKVINDPPPDLAPLFAYALGDNHVTFKAMDGSVPDVTVTLGILSAHAQPAVCFNPLTNRFYWRVNIGFPDNTAWLYKIDPDLGVIETTVPIAQDTDGTDSAFFVEDKNSAYFAGGTLIFRYDCALDTIAAFAVNPAITGYENSNFKSGFAYVESTNEIWAAVRADNVDTFNRENWIYILDADDLTVKEVITMPVGDFGSNIWAMVYCPSNDRVYAQFTPVFEQATVRVYDPVARTVETTLNLDTNAQDAAFAIYDPHSDLVLIPLDDNRVAVICPSANTLQGYTANMLVIINGAAYSGTTQAVYFIPGENILELGQP